MRISDRSINRVGNLTCFQPGLRSCNGYFLFEAELGVGRKDKIIAGKGACLHNDHDVLDLSRLRHP
jgi:hypothetical protein